MLVAARVEVAPVDGEAHQEAQLLQSQVGAGKVAAPVARVGGLDEGVEHVERHRLDAVAEQEPLRPGVLHRLNEPGDQPVVRFDGRPGAACVVCLGLTLPVAQRRRTRPEMPVETKLMAWTYACSAGGPLRAAD